MKSWKEILLLIVIIIVLIIALLFFVTPTSLRYNSSRDYQASHPANMSGTDEPTPGIKAQ